MGNHLHWGVSPDGFDAYLYSLENEFLRVQLTDIGASLVSLECADRHGRFGNVVVSGATAADYFVNPCHLGQTVGRFANRIGRGRFWLEGREYVLATNNGPNHLHGGVRGIGTYIWGAEPGERQVTFRWWSLDGQEGYPGNLNIAVTYRLDGPKLCIDYSARTDQPTIVNLTNHAYWNLNSHGSILNHELRLHAEHYLENDRNVLPTGNILSVKGTPYDFLRPHAIGRDMASIGGYDNCFVIDGWDGRLRPAARVSSAQTGRAMEVWTTEPGIQLYTGNFLDGSEKCKGYGRHEAFCLECQHFPDSPNQPDFPSTTLRPGEEYTQSTEHRFAVE